MLKWSLQKDFICIPRSSKKSRIIENFDLFDFRMAEGDMQTLVSSGVSSAVFDCFSAMQTKLDDHYITDWPEAMTTYWLP